MFEKSTASKQEVEGQRTLTYSDSIDIFLGYARDKTLESEASNLYDSMLGGDGHPLENCTAEQIDFAIKTLIQDMTVPWNRKASMFHEMMDTLQSRQGEKISEALYKLATSSPDSYIQSQALEAMTYLATNEGNFFWDNLYANYKLPPLETLRTLAGESTGYFIRLRAQAFLTAKEGGELDLIPRTDEDESNFELSKGVEAIFDKGFDTLHILDTNGNSRAINASDLTDKSLTEEESHRALFNFQFMSRPNVREHIREDFGVELAQLNLKEQYQFLNHIISASTDLAGVIRDHTHSYGINFVRTFLSLERGDESLGDDIVEFGKHQEVAMTVFRYYGELLNSAERAESLVREVSDCEGDICLELANQVHENIVNRAQKDLEKAVQSHDPGEVAAQIENYVAAAKEYVALLQEVGAGKIEAVNSSELSTDEQDRMKILMKANYDKAYPEPENEDFKAAIAGSLEKSFSNPDTSFRVLRDNGKIVSYNRFDTTRDSTGKEVSYFGSFNADPAYSGVGSVMLEETIKDQLEIGRPMMAHCDPTQAITRKYIEDGFVATGLYELAGKPSFEIWRSKDSSAQLESKGRSVDELLELVGESGAMVVREQSESETYPELQNGMGLTRYFTHDGKTYLVFETLPDTLKGELTSLQEEQKEAA